MIKKPGKVCIKINDKGPQVKGAQELLRKAGSTIKVTGVFTIGMYAAVKAFQKKNGLKVTGVIDAKTLEVLGTYKSKKIVKMAPKKK